MADRRIDKLCFTASPTLATSGASLLYGCLVAGGSNASMWIADAGALANVALTARVATVNISSVGGCPAMRWSPPLQMSAGVFASMAGGGVGYIYYSQRN